MNEEANPFYKNRKPQVIAEHLRELSLYSFTFVPALANEADDGCQGVS